MAPRIKIPATKYPVERFTLGNGLRVVLSPDRSAPVVGVAVVYDVGIRSEPEGRTGFAHLFEHLMFQGSENLEKLAHFRHVQGAGGSFNGSTHLDYTDYFEVLPSGGLERALFLEADRMRGPRLTEENLRNQVDVVKEEIRVNVLNRPYGGFPWLKLPPVMFETFPNAHDGYGSFEDLESATVEDAQGFFDRYYACGNAVLSVAGDFDVAEATAMIERHFGDVPARPAPRLPDFFEPDLTAERRESYVDRIAPLPAVAGGWRVPDPIATFDDYLPFVVLAEVLTDGDASRLVERLVQRDRTATTLGGYIGFMGDEYQVRNPTALLLQAHLPPGGDADKVLRTIDEELDRLAADGLKPGELDRTQARMATRLLHGTDDVLGRALPMAVLELQRGRPEMLNDLPKLISEVRAEQIVAAAATLRPERRASVEVIPGASA
ncbi:putative Zn-dependent peptidase [Actinoplanes campanulatus]|uniref:Putative Zn-dependent peptidase n=1 Tax=Actinoplanes campanulatus TaxID=113559 RepID=A0A7W5FCN3_9ACTN|nr:pitrilysin family protein [Actinoplanes campanulatus]MBB3093446.1 putative Zn-dependent peptidase [Actinoplanes campanulatus]GGN50208.1 peptidase M16 [Actinoplanes campanulatus]GID42437.1 peptidase M16 [Actinoplanes campanulatus]